MTRTSLSAAILIGGSSRRMGTPKALLRLESGGPTLIEAIAARLATLTPDVMLVGTAAWPIPEPLAGLAHVADPGGGAADGVVAALGRSAGAFCIVVGCDMPFLHPPLLQRMADMAREAGRGVVACDADGVHPLHAVYRRGDLTELASAMAEGERSMVALAARVGMLRHRLDAPSVSGADRASVVNLNTPADVAAARARLRR